MKLDMLIMYNGLWDVSQSYSDAKNAAKSLQQLGQSRR